MRCLKKHTQKSPHFISFRVWFGRATSCTLRGNRGLRIGVESFVQQVARYEGIANHVSGFIIRATSCTLHSKWITLLTVDDTLSEMHGKITALFFVPCEVPSCIEMHATRESWITHRGWIIRATSCTLRGNRKSRIEVDSFVHQDARYEGIINHLSGLIHSCYWIQKAYLV